MTLSTRRPVSRVPTPVPAENGANGGRNSVVLGPKDRLVGQLYIEGDLQVAGTVAGRVTMGKHKAQVASEPEPVAAAIPEPVAQPEPVTPQDWGLSTPKRKKK